jgi:hypothetical protein
MGHLSWRVLGLWMEKCRCKCVAHAVADSLQEVVLELGRTLSTPHLQFYGCEGSRISTFTKIHIWHNGTSRVFLSHLHNQETFGVNYCLHFEFLGEFVCLIYPQKKGKLCNSKIRFWRRRNSDGTSTKSRRESRIWTDLLDSSGSGCTSIPS